MQMLFVSCNRTLRRDFVHNLVCLLLSGLFVYLMTLSLSLFYTERMPNGKDMVIAFPQLEYGSPSWVLYLPINLFATCAYGLTIYTYVAYTVLTAPRRIGTERGFLARYRFCFDTKRPDRWWWVIVKMSFGLSICLVQVVLPANNVHSHIYTSVLAMFTMIVILYGAWPWKFDSNNWVELMCKITLAVLLMLTTSFIDVNSISQVERDRMNNVWAHIIVCTVIGAFAVCAALFVADIAAPMQNVRVKQVRTARAMWHLRDMSLALLMMPEKEYAKRLATVGDSDRALLLEVTKNIKNVIFGQQESSRWMNQRLIAGREYEVWDHGQRVLGFLQESTSGRLQERLDQSMRFRRRLLELAVEISEAGRAPPPLTRSSILAAHSAIGVALQPRRRLSRNEEETGTASGILDRARSRIFSAPGLTHAAFSRKISSFAKLSMSEEEVDTLFGVLDSNGSGTVSHQQLTELLAALAPEKVLRALARDGENGDAVDAWRNTGSERHACVTPWSRDEQEKEEERIRGAPPDAAADLVRSPEWPWLWPSSWPSVAATTDVMPSSTLAFGGAETAAGSRSA
ncbi:unnamed protein product [Prorocentrum cordatum]|uniref:EF-hand domain-containing protein n=1 Tax=Prorocentrum cordatum TaxID=2364126 RepID=A0ABN9QNN9_9DINO|nr:unnamed protein product [Polarella glacialis]